MTRNGILFCVVLTGVALGALSGCDRSVSLGINIEPPGAGEVERIPSQREYDLGDQVTLHAQAGSGYRFSEWTGDARGRDNPITVKIIGDMRITAYFLVDGIDPDGAEVTPEVSDIHARQRNDAPGLVDIEYTLTGGGDGVYIALTYSTDHGDTWRYITESSHVSGAVGLGIESGRDKRITWDLGSELGHSLCAVMFRVTATLATQTILLPGDVPLVMVRIPAGTYMRGRYSGEQGSYSSEDPQHQVTLTQDFYLGKYPLTQAPWFAVRGSWPGTAPSSSYGVGDDYPAYNVSWDDAQNFIASLNAHITSTDQGSASFRLPTEAEWEYACRAGTTTRFYWGDDLDDTEIDNYAWYKNNSPNGTKPVGGKLPNPWGLYDMSGNVWEWCQDWYGDYPAGPLTDPTGPTSGSNRVRRGASWINPPGSCRSAFRYGSTPGEQGNGMGFRLAWPAVQ